MEKKHKKLKRNLNDDDGYELACRYDIGWSKSKKLKKKRKHGIDGEISDKHEDGKNVNNKKAKHGDSSSIEIESEVEKRCDDENASLNSSKNNDLSKKQKSLDIKNRIKRRRKMQRVDTSFEQDNVDPDCSLLHSQWKFTKKQMEEMKREGVKVKMGSWSQEEIDTLERNMAEYLKTNNVNDPTPLVLAENGKRKKYVKAQSMETNFYRSLGKGIHRPLFHIYRHVLRKYNPDNNAGRWTETEKQELFRFHALYGDQWTKIGNCIGRSGMAVQRKFREIQGKNGGDWSEEEIERLDASVRASTGTDFGSQIYGDINWVEVADFVMTRTSNQCRSKWLKDVCWKDASGEKNIKWNFEDDVKLIERLYGASEKHENDINWVVLTKDLSKAPSVTWLRCKWTKLKRVVPNYTECDFEEILDYLYNTHRPFLKKKTSDT